MIGDAWDVGNPKKPTLEWDVNANIAIPFGLNAWLDELGAEYGDHEVIAPAPLELVSKGGYAADAAGTVQVRVKVAAGASIVSGRSYPFTLRVKGADAVTQDDRTFYLKVFQR